MSKAFYKPSVAPKLLHSLTVGNKSKVAAIIEIWNTTCIVTNFGLSTRAPKCTVLINPANPQLSGVSKFPYFPRGGPVPKEFAGFVSQKKWQPLGYVSQWGGMEIGTGMLYPVSVVDGMVHQLGGRPLRFEIMLLPTKDRDDNIKCPLGEAVVTTSGLFSTELSKEYAYIVHTAPPFYEHCPRDDPRKTLRNCYRNSLAKASSLTVKGAPPRVAVPLLGAGARGFPMNVAIEIAVCETVSWCREQCESSGDGNKVLYIAFGIPDECTADLLVKKFQESSTI